VIYRITFGFTGAGVGWSENHAMLNATTNPTTLFPTLADIAAKRVQMLGNEFSIVAIRVSKYATDAGVRVRGVTPLKRTFSNSNTGATGRAEPANVALLVRGYAEPSQLAPQFDDNSKQIWLGAPLDISVDAAGHVFEDKGGLGAAFASWRAAMLATTMGWLADEIILDAPILSIAQVANGRVALTFAADVLAPIGTGKFRANIREVNGGHSPLKGALIVTKTSDTVLTTTEVIGIPTPQTPGAIKVYKQVKTFVDYGELLLADTTGKHKRGRPFGSTPGRLPARVRG